jgi:hypothetical protein
MQERQKGRGEKLAQPSLDRQGERQGKEPSLDRQGEGQGKEPSLDREGEGSETTSHSHCGQEQPCRRG